MPQLGLLYMLVYLPMNALSGSNTRLESVPPWLAKAMQSLRSTYFVSFAQSILYRASASTWSGRNFFLVTVIRRRDLALRTGGVENGSAWRSPRAVRSGRRKLRRTAICTSFFIAGRRSERVRHGSMPL